MTSPSPKEFKVQPSVGKITACIFWDSQRLILVDFVPPGITLNANYYTSLFSDYCVQQSAGKPPNRLQQGVIFHQDNAPPQRAHQTTQKTTETAWELFACPLHSPDLATSDFHLFGPLSLVESRLRMMMQ